jgi:diguanylate cyclase (GGDEF)-like protein
VAAETMMRLAVEQRQNEVRTRSGPTDAAPVVSMLAKINPAMSDARFAFAPAALCIINRQKRFEVVNARMARILGPAPGYLIGCSVEDVLPNSGPTLDRFFSLVDAGKAIDDQEISWQGGQYQLSFEATLDHGRVVGLSIAATDITRRARIEQRLRKSRRHLLTKTRHDYLTGLLNRRGLEAKLHQEIRRACRGGKHIALLVVDIDCFKAYNDHFGHVAGDECLRAVASALGNCVRRAGDAAARYGGEEFVLVLPEANPAGAAAIAESCREAVDKLDLGHPTSDFGRVTISIGVASIRPDYTSSDVSAQAAVLMRGADEALYIAKAQGRNCVCLL